jgi:DNA-binding transcriptional MerR regulator
MKQQGLKTGELAKKAGVTVETIRHYEREQLLEMPDRLQSGYRVYQPKAVSVVLFIKRLQQLGFSLKEVKAFLALVASPPNQSQDDIVALIETKLLSIASKVSQYQTIFTELKHLQQLYIKPASKAVAY